MEIFNTKFTVFSKESIDFLEEKYKVKYIGDFDYLLPDQNYSNNAAALFYRENPDLEKGHSNYLGIIKGEGLNGEIYLINGERCIKDPLPGVKDNKGNIYISSFNHDFKSCNNYEFIIDGGRGGCTRYKGDLVYVTFDKDKLVELNNEIISN